LPNRESKIGLRSARQPIEARALSQVDIRRQINGAKIVLGKELHLNGRKVDAINTPNLQSIEVDEVVCSQQPSGFYENILGLLIHEHLGLARVDDTRYQFSTKMLSEARELLRSLFSQDADSDPCRNSLNIEKNKLLAGIIAREPGYKNLISQWAKKDTKPDVFNDWIMNEINNESVMRDQIADLLADLSRNGRNSSEMTTFLSRTREQCSTFRFSKESLKIARVKSLGGNRSLFKASLHAKDGYHRGYSIIKYDFTFEAEIKPVTYTGRPTYEISVVSYPVFAGATDIDCGPPGPNPKVCDERW
jgi:hypothetical protein